MRAIEAPDGGVWAPRDMAAYMQKSKARSAKAVVPLAAWVDVRKLQPDLRNVYGRERNTWVMDMLEKSTRDGTCSCACWLSYYRAGTR